MRDADFAEVDFALFTHAEELAFADEVSRSTGERVFPEVEGGLFNYAMDDLRREDRL